MLKDFLITILGTILSVYHLYWLKVSLKLVWIKHSYWFYPALLYSLVIPVLLYLLIWNGVKALCRVLIKMIEVIKYWVVKGVYWLRVLWWWY